MSTESIERYLKDIDDSLMVIAEELRVRNKLEPSRLEIAAMIFSAQMSTSAVEIMQMHKDSAKAAVILADALIKANKEFKGE